jgi:hypothetical protein
VDAQLELAAAALTRAEGILDGPYLKANAPKALGDEAWRTFDGELEFVGNLLEDGLSDSTIWARFLELQRCQLGLKAKQLRIIEAGRLLDPAGAAHDDELTEARDEQETPMEAAHRRIAERGGMVAGYVDANGEMADPVVVAPVGENPETFRASVISRLTVVDRRRARRALGRPGRRPHRRTARTRRTAAAAHAARSPGRPADDDPSRLARLWRVLARLLGGAR